MLPDHWFVYLETGAEEDLIKLDRIIRRRVLVKLEWLRINFDNIIPDTLSGKLSHLYKLRVSDWRVIYVPIEKARRLSVIAIDHRGKIYSRL